MINSSLTMAELLAKQQSLQREIERYLANFKKVGRNNLTPKIRSRISTLKETWNQFRLGHVALEGAFTEINRSSISYFKDNQFELTEPVYHTALDHMADCLEELDPYVSPNQSFEAGHHSPGFTSAFALSHLPPINLPPFDGQYEEWESFRDRFTTLIINNKDLSNFSRMHFLVSCLKDRALDCVKELSVTANNFDIAWRMLIARFENKRRLINAHMSTLLNLPVASRESALELQATRDKLNNAVAALDKLNRSPEELWSDILVSLGSQKLDNQTRKAWNLKFSEDRSPLSYDDFKKFLDTRIRALEEWKPSQSSPEKSKSANAQKISSSNACAKPLPQCALCKAKHYFHVCPKFVSKSPSQRRELVKLHKRCFNCLSDKHSVQACQSRFSCRVCHKKHHSMLHSDSDSCSQSDPSGNVSLDNSMPEPPESTPAVNSMVASTTRTRSAVLLATAWITVRVPSGRSAVVRALLDQGSEMTFVSENLAQMLRAKRIRMPISVSAVGGIHAGTFRYATQISISE